MPSYKFCGTSAWAISWDLKQIQFGIIKGILPHSSHEEQIPDSLMFLVLAPLIFSHPIVKLDARRSISAWNTGDKIQTDNLACLVSPNQNLICSMHCDNEFDFDHNVCHTHLFARSSCPRTTLVIWPSMALILAPISFPFPFRNCFCKFRHWDNNSSNS